MVIPKPMFIWVTLCDSAGFGYVTVIGKDTVQLKGSGRRNRGQVKGKRVWEINDINTVLTYKSLKN